MKKESGDDGNELMFIRLCAVLVFLVTAVIINAKDLQLAKMYGLKQNRSQRCAEMWLHDGNQSVAHQFGPPVPSRFDCVTHDRR